MYMVLSGLFFSVSATILPTYHGVLNSSSVIRAMPHEHSSISALVMSPRPHEMLICILYACMSLHGLAWLGLTRVDLA